VPKSQPVSLTFDRSVASLDKAKSSGGFDGAGRSLPAEMLPSQISYAGVEFGLAPASKPNALVARGQTIPLPAGKFNRLYVLAASAEGDQKATFRVGDRPVDLTIQDWSGHIGQWDDRQWKISDMQMPPEPAPGDTSKEARKAARIREHLKEYGSIKVLEYQGLTPGFIKPASVAWFASHRHTADGANDIYAYSYLYAYSLDVPANARTLMLPDNSKVRILAVTVTDDDGQVRPVQPLYDTLQRAER
jgi:alpha-mannosidase